MKKLIVCILTLVAMAACRPEQHFQLLSPQQVKLSQEGGTFTVELDANVEFTLSIPAEASSWLHQGLTKDAENIHKITVAVDRNTEVDTRESVLTISSALGNASVTVSQLGETPALSISPRNLDIPSMGGEFDTKVSSNLDIELEVLPASCDWVQMISSKTISTSTYAFQVAPNDVGEDREMSLVFKNVQREFSDTLHVRQKYIPGFTFTTNHLEVKAPLLKQPGEGTMVYWGDGSSELYGPDLTHHFATPGQHTVVVEGNPVDPIRISDLEDGMVIDFSRIIKKEVAQ